jgi:hypothetical protein
MKFTYEIEAQRTEYNGVLYRSKLEAEWAKLLQRECSDRYTIKYEPETFYIKRMSRWYTPDFLIEGKGISEYFEVKPCIEAADFATYEAFAEEKQEELNSVNPSETVEFTVLVGGTSNNERIKYVFHGKWRIYTEFHGCILSVHTTTRDLAFTVASLNRE